MIRKFFRSGSRGFSFIEQAMVIPLALAFVFGSIDVTNYFRAQNALKEGVHEGLRCLYPTDGECIDVAAPEYRAVNDLYIPPFFALKHDYDGREEHLILPDYSFSSISARTLNRAQYSINSARYGVQRDLYPASGLVKAIRQTRPRLAGGNPLTASISNGIGLGFSGSPRGDQASCSTGNSDEVEIGSLEFTIPPAPYSGTSYLNQIDDLIIKSTITGDSTRAAFDELSHRANLFFKFNGSGYAYNTRTQQSTQNGQWHGHVEMKAQIFQNGQWRTVSGGDLGGRDFPTASAQHLVPRGFTEDESRAHFGNNFGGYQGELQAHTSTTVPFNSRARVLFTVRGDQGEICHPDIRVGWDLTSAQIVMSEYDVLEDSPDCQSPLARSQCSSNCQINPQSSSLYADLQSHVGPNLETNCAASPSSHDDLRRTLSCNPEATDFHTLATSLGVPSHLVSDYSELPPVEAGCPTSESRNCGANFGVSTPSEYDNTGAFVRNSLEAQEICPVPGYAVPGTAKWYEHTNTVYSNPIIAAESDCSIRPGTILPSNLIPPEVLQYKKLNLPSAHLSNSAPSYKYQGDPDDLKELSQFSCQEVGIGRLRFDEDHINEFQEPMRSLLRQSLFNGAHEQLGCSIENILRQEAVRVGMNTAAHFEVTKDVAVPDTETQISHIKVDSCVVANADTSLMTTNLRTKVGGGPFFENTTPPSCIINGINYCIEIPAGVRKIEPDGKYTVDVNGARLRAVNAIEAFMPSGKTDPTCEQSGGADCVKVEFLGGTGSETFDPLKDDFHMKASMNLPLLVLGSEPMTVAYEAKRAWEGKYTK